MNILQLEEKNYRFMLHSKTLLKIGIIGLLLSLNPLPVTAIAQLKPVQIQKPSFTNTFIAATENQKRTALVIGNSNYQKVIRLGNPVNDATDIAQALEKLGFEVILIKDSNLRQMRDAIDNVNIVMQNAIACDNKILERDNFQSCR